MFSMCMSIYANDYKKASKYDQKIPQSHTADQHHEEEPQNTKIHKASGRQLQ